MTRTAFITGVSTGIGAATARYLLEQEIQVFGTVRKKSDAKSLENDFLDSFHKIVMDVTDQPSIDKAANTVRKSLGQRKLGALINNSGIAVVGPVSHLPAEELTRQLDVNIVGMHRVTQAFLPLLGMEKNRQGQSGKIINISSIAGKISGPFFSPYSASKFAVEAFSDSLRRELIAYGIDVSSVRPGPIKSQIWEKTESIDHKPFEGSDYETVLKKLAASSQKMNETALEASEVGKLIYKIIDSSKPKTRYTILKNKFSMYTLPRLLPKRVLDKALAKRYGLLK